MPRVSFGKYQGLGNDFVVVDQVFVTAAGARRMCDRRRGIGADGVLTLLPPRDPRASVRMHIYNADGSVAEMCGNGLRCVVRKLLSETGAPEVVVDTDAGILAGRLEDEAVRVELGVVSTIAESVPVELDGTSVNALGVSVGNPHLVLPAFPQDADLMALARAHGPRLERSPLFPERVNVELVKPAADGLELVVFERGSGITQACGTGAAAAAYASLMRGTVPRSPVQVRLPGGPLVVHVAGDRVEITGPAEHVFDGVLELDPEELLRGP